jgi:hypothetical protein
LGVADLPPSPMLHHAILLAFSVDPGVRAFNMQMAFAFALHSLCSCSAADAASLPDEECDFIFAFSTRDRAGRTSLPIHMRNTEYELRERASLASKQSCQVARCMDSDGSPLHSVTTRK